MSEINKEELLEESTAVLGEQLDTTVDHEYKDEDIQVLDGLEAVRKRPGMYIASTSSKGLHHLVWEIVDNGIDEAMAGYATTISVSVDNDNIVISYKEKTRLIKCEIVRNTIDKARLAIKF